MLCLRFLICMLLLHIPSQEVPDHRFEPPERSLNVELVLSNEVDLLSFYLLSRELIVLFQFSNQFLGLLRPVSFDVPFHSYLSREKLETLALHLYMRVLCSRRFLHFDSFDIDFDRIASDLLCPPRFPRKSHLIFKSEWGLSKVRAASIRVAPSTSSTRPNRTTATTCRRSPTETTVQSAPLRRAGDIHLDARRQQRFRDGYLHQLDQPHSAAARRPRLLHHNRTLEVR